MAQIQKGTTYTTGDQVTAANLNALADAAILLPGAITDQTAKTVPLAADTVLIHSAADTALRKSTLTQLFANATGIPISTGISGLGTGIATALAVNSGSTGAPALLGSAGAFTTLSASGAISSSGSQSNNIGAGGTGTGISQFVLNGGSGTNGGSNIAFNKNSVGKAIVGIDSCITGGTSDNLMNYVASGGTIRNYVGGTGDIGIFSSTGLGIGITPSALLQVANTGRALAVLRILQSNQTAPFTETFAAANDGGGASPFIYSGQPGGSFPFDAYGELVIQGNPRAGYNNGISFVTGTGSSQAVVARISGSNFGIGTSSPAAMLHVTGSSRFDSDSSFNLRIFVRNPAGQDWALRTNTSSNNFEIVDWGSTLTRVSITTAGAIRFNAYGAGALTTDASGNITASSDERIKSNIRPFSRGLAEILAINPILHGYTEESGLDQSRDDYAGFSAQQVQTIIPEAIGANADGMLSFSDRPVMAALVNAMKELNANLVAELQSVRQRLAALESN